MPGRVPPRNATDRNSVKDSYVCLKQGFEVHSSSKIGACQGVPCLQVYVICWAVGKVHWPHRPVSSDQEAH